MRVEINKNRTEKVLANVYVDHTFGGLHIEVDDGDSYRLPEELVRILQ